MRTLNRLAQFGWQEFARLGVNPESGFVPVAPVLESKVDGVKVLARAAKMVSSGEESSILDDLQRLPQVEVGGLAEEEHEHVFLVLQILVQKYYQSQTTSNVRRIPRNLSLPFKALASSLQRPPVLQYASLQYHNFSFKDHQVGFHPDNLEVPYLLSGTQDEAWFYIAATASDVRGAPVLRKLNEYLVKPGDESLSELLRTISSCLAEMKIALKIIRAGVSPQIFYDQIRPQLKDYTHKVWFDEVSSEPEYYVGPSAIQSPMLRILNLLLGLQTNKPEMLAAETHMMKSHRELIEAVKALDLSSKVPSSLADEFNECLHQMKLFRYFHYGLVKDYIIRRGPETHGTGGTPLDQFLAGLINETSAQTMKASTPKWTVESN
jgi:hypothetical protein